MTPGSAAMAMKGLGAVAGLFGKNKTKVKDIPLSPTITAGLNKNEKFLSGDMMRNRSETDRGFSEWEGLMPRLKGQLDSDLGTIGRYRSGGAQERRRLGAINRYGDALRAGNQDALAGVTKNANHQQAMMGSGGAMSPFMASLLMGQQGALNRGVARELGGLRLGNIDRYEGFDRADIGRGAGLMGAYGRMQSAPLHHLMLGDKANRDMFAGAIANRRNSMDRLISKKPNTMQKISNAFSGGGQAMQDHMLSTAYMNKLDPSGQYNNWKTFGIKPWKNKSSEAWKDPGNELS